jgi:hypothetical protein
MDSLSVMKGKSLITLTSGANVLKPFFFVIDAQSEKAKAFVPLQSSLMFEDKAYMLNYDGCPNLVGFDSLANITYARLLKRFVRDKHSSLFVGDKEKRLQTLTTIR